MSMLTIQSIECIKLQEVGPDEVRIDRDNEPLTGPHIMRKGRTLSLGVTTSFSDAVSISLTEVDSSIESRNEHLGSHTVRANEAGQGTKSTHFRSAGADYHMKYSVR